MSVRILSEAEVHRLLPMDECIAAMEGALAALAREELFNPLRFVIRPPGEETLIGLMPAHRSGEHSVYALKTICIAPANAELGLDLHQGFVALFDGVTGQTRALMSASAITAIRTAAVSARGDETARAPRVAGRSRSSAPARRRAPTSRRCARCCPSTRFGPGAGRRAGRRSSTVSSRSAPPRKPSAAPTSSSPRPRRASRSSTRVAERGHPRERGRVEHPEHARARHPDDRRGGALRRPARVDPQRGRATTCSRCARARSGPIDPRASSARS